MGLGRNLGRGVTRWVAAVGVATSLLAAVLVAATAGDASAERADEAALSQARDQVRAVRDELGDARGDMSTAQAALAAADEQLARIEEALNEAARALERQEHEVATFAQRVADLETEIAEQQEAFSERAADMYKRGAGVPFAVILNASSAEDVLDRGAYLQALSSSDVASLERIVALRTQADSQRVLLNAERERLEAMKHEQEELLAEVAELREHRAIEVAAARAEVSELESHLAAAEAEADEIERIIRENERRARAYAGAQTASRAGYIWPRCAAVTSGYGMRWGRMHRGIDINGNTGDPIHAAKAGRVIFTGRQGGYGNLVLIDHRDGVVTAYAHLSSFAVSRGRDVMQGEIIGAVGSTGQSTGPHLHFETRVHGSAQNPRNFLPSRC